MPTQSFDLAPGRDYIELNQLLKLVGLCDSGGAGKLLVDSGAVLVDGVPESRRTAKIHAGQRVAVGHFRIQVRAGEPDRQPGALPRGSARGR